MYFLTYNYYIMFFWLLLVRDSLIWQLVSFLRLEESGIVFVLRLLLQRYIEWTEKV